MTTCITGVEEKRKDIRIAFLGYNNKLTQSGLRQFVDNNIEQVIQFDTRRNLVYLRDGTFIKAFTSTDMQSLMGYRFDQLILFDDDRWEIWCQRLDDIVNIRKYTMMMSNIPEKFQILEYEDIR